jgi:Domain of unknown function (DUF4169)
MSKVVNLNKFRKKKTKEARQKQAEANRRLHGRTKAERASEALQKKQLAAKVEQAQLIRTPEADEPSSPEQG